MKANHFRLLMSRKNTRDMFWKVEKPVAEIIEEKQTLVSDVDRLEWMKKYAEKYAEEHKDEMNGDIKAGLKP